MTIAIATAGTHPTTQACIEMLQWLQERAECKNILEIGCGNGILALTAAMAWDANVLAADISENAVADTKRNIDEYQLQERVSVVRSDGLSHKATHENAPYDLIIANLLAKTLIFIATDVKKASAAGGYVLLSGSLSWLAADVEIAYKSLGFEIVRQNSFSSWNSYLLCHKADT